VKYRGSFQKHPGHSDIASGFSSYENMQAILASMLT
jgi:hypothetical protein